MACPPSLHRYFFSRPRLGRTAACTIAPNSRIVLLTRYFGYLAACVAALVCLVAPSFASAAPHVPGELIVKYRAGTDESARAAARRAAGVQPAGRVAARTERVRVTSGSASAAAAILERDPSVAHAVPNYL